METDPEVVVVGGGLAGLTAAASLACAGRSVELHERAPSLGGRAATHERQGFLFNQGAHALYAGGAAHRERHAKEPLVGRRTAAAPGRSRRKAALEVSGSRHQG